MKDEYDLKNEAVKAETAHRVRAYVGGVSLGMACSTCLAAMPAGEPARLVRRRAVDTCLLAHSLTHLLTYLLTTCNSLLTAHPLTHQLEMLKGRAPYRTMGRSIDFFDGHFEGSASHPYPSPVPRL